MLGRGFRVTFTKHCYCLCRDKVLRSQNGGNYLGEFGVSWGLDTNWFSTHWACPDCNSNMATVVLALLRQHCVNKDLESTWTAVLHTVYSLIHVKGAEFSGIMRPRKLRTKRCLTALTNIHKGELSSVTSWCRLMSDIMIHAHSTKSRFDLLSLPC